MRAGRDVRDDERAGTVDRADGESVGVAAGFMLGRSGRPAELVMATGETDVDTVQTLARIADACASDAAAVIALGSVQPGTTLELHVSAL